jgi:peptidoglycan/xylan/chitin deacetylase (PgdA/CDA1 family)
MKIRGMWRARQAAQWLRKQVAPQVLVLMYHRVIELPSDPYELIVTPRHFEEQMEVLRKFYRPIPLPQLAGALRDEARPRRLTGLEELGDVWRGENLPRNAVVLTFDDGYVDNLLNAKPILERYEVPATVFVATGYVGKGWEFWWDELQHQVLEPGTLPETVHIDLPGEALEFSLGEAATYTETAYQALRYWNGSMPETPGPRQQFLMALIDRLRPLPEADQRHALNQLMELTGKTTQREEYRQVTVEELCRLGDGGLIEIGAHTMTHPMLSAHPPEVQREEILQSRFGLEEMLGRPVTNFAYPFGATEHYNEDTVAILRDNGFTATVTTTPGLVQRTTDRYQLPRHVVRDWDGNTFAAKLEEFFHG